MISRFECRKEYPVQFKTWFLLSVFRAEFETMQYRLSRQMRGSGGWMWKDLLRFSSLDIDKYVSLSNNGAIFGYFVDRLWEYFLHIKSIANFIMF